MFDCLMIIHIDFYNSVFYVCLYACVIVYIYIMIYIKLILV